MASSEAHQSTPMVKFEASPVESLLSVPGDIYPSLFEAATPEDSNTMDPLECVLTPASTMDAEDTPAPEGASDKKPVKKRKSWGQVLPEPKTNLPPRKRAKTEDEKEQRRVERVLRNRRAAQSSRERKRQEVEALEERCKQLEDALRERNNTVDLLMDEMQRLRGQPGRSSSPLNAYHNQPSPLSLSKPLFGSDGEQMDDFILMPESNGTVNPASLSPAMSPVPDDNTEDNSTAATSANDAAATPEATSTDMTQHPAVSVGEGSSGVVGIATSAAASAVSLSAAPNAADSLLGDAFGLPASLDLDSWSTQEQFSPSSDPLNFEYNHMAGDAAPQFPEFDFEQFLSDDISGAQGASAGNGAIAQEHESSFGFFDSENQIPSETSNQQPLPGASSLGCDDGVLAVGV